MKKTDSYARLSKRGYAFRNGRMLTVVPIATLRENPSLREALGVTNEQWEAITKGTENI